MALKGTNGDDRFGGTIFADEEYGFRGDDFFSGSPGGDTIVGGLDVDTVDYSEFVSLGLFPIVIEGNAVDVDLERTIQFAGLADGDMLFEVENIGGSGEGDLIRGDAQVNALFGAGGDDTIEGRNGADHLEGDATFGFILYGDPNGSDHLDGGAGDDLIRGNGGSDTLIGGLDDDQLFGEAGNDTLFGDPGLDRLDGGAGVDSASYANSGAAVTVFLNAGIGAGGDAAGDVLVSVENVTGSLFADSLFGSSADNVLRGDGGNDTLAGLGGGDTLDGGNGLDTASYAGSGSAVLVDLAAGIAAGGDAAGDSLVSIENLTGSGFADFLFGNGSGNVLDGGAGADILLGAGGNDVYVVDNVGDAISEAAGQGSDEVRTSISYTLGAVADVETLRTTSDAGTGAIDLTGNATNNAVRGNNGANVINGGAGNDQLTGLAGQDSFLFATALNAATNVDVITDFTVADDTILLDDAVFTSLALGNLPVNRFVIGAAAQDANDRIIYNNTNGVLLFDSDGSGGAAAVQFAQLSAGLALTNLDFLVV